MQDFVLVVEAGVHDDEGLDFILRAAIQRAFRLWWRRVLRTFVPLLLHHLQILIVLFAVSKISASGCQSIS